MQFAACVVSVVPVRKSPAHESEMVNQLLFGETMEVLESTTANWWRIKSLHDQYEGWVSSMQVKTLNEKEALSSGSWVMESTGMAEKIQTDTGDMFIPFGSSLTGFNGIEGKIGDFRYQYNGTGARKKVNSEPM